MADLPLCKRVDILQRWQEALKAGTSTTILRAGIDLSSDGDRLRAVLSRRAVSIGEA
jgi:hypothetical protein